MTTRAGTHFGGLTIFALAVSACGLGGCVATGSPDYVATAPVPDEQAAAAAGHGGLDSRIAHHAHLHQVPESLIHTAIRRESKYNPAAKHGPYWGLMQIRYDTARSMGYSGPANGLLDAETNLTYAVPYLANAYTVAGGDERRAIRLFASGYYYEAKRRGLLSHLHTAKWAADNAE